MRITKITIFLLLATFVLLAGCIGCENSQINEGRQAEVIKTAAGTNDEANAALTDNEAKEILTQLLPKAVDIVAGMFNGSGAFKEDASQAIPGEEQYRRIYGDKWKSGIDTSSVNSIADLKQVVEQVFTRDTAQKQLYSRYLETTDTGLPLYKDYEGRLYVNTQNGGHGWATQFLIDTAKVKSQKDHAAEITLNTTVLDDPYGTAIIKIEYVNGQWLMASGLDDYETIINGSAK